MDEVGGRRIEGEIAMPPLLEQCPEKKEGEEGRPDKFNLLSPQGIVNNFSENSSMTHVTHSTSPPFVSPLSSTIPAKIGNWLPQENSAKAYGYPKGRIRSRDIVPLIAPLLMDRRRVPQALPLCLRKLTPVACPLPHVAVVLVDDPV